MPRFRPSIRSFIARTVSASWQDSRERKSCKRVALANSSMARKRKKRKGRWSTRASRAKQSWRWKSCSTKRTVSVEDRKYRSFIYRIINYQLASWVSTIFYSTFFLLKFLTRNFNEDTTILLLDFDYLIARYERNMIYAALLNVINRDGTEVNRRAQVQTGNHV